MGWHHPDVPHEVTHTLVSPHHGTGSTMTASTFRALLVSPTSRGGPRSCRPPNSPWCPVTRGVPPSPVTRAPAVPAGVHAEPPLAGPRRHAEAVRQLPEPPAAPLQRLAAPRLLRRLGLHQRPLPAEVWALRRAGGGHCGVLGGTAACWGSLGGHWGCWEALGGHWGVLEALGCCWGDSGGH